MKLITKNKHAYHDYEISREFEAWIILKWHEVKSIKLSHVNIKDSFARIEDWEAWINNMDIPLYAKTSINLIGAYDPKWKRKLLLNKKELAKISSELDKWWKTLVPLEVYINKNRLIKIKIWLWKLMKKVEKKQILKEKDVDRQAKREIKNFRI